MGQQYALKDAARDGSIAHESGHRRRSSSLTDNRCWRCLKPTENANITSARTHWRRLSNLVRQTACRPTAATRISPLARIIHEVFEDTVRQHAKCRSIPIDAKLSDHPILAPKDFCKGAMAAEEVELHYSSCFGEAC